MKFNSDRRVSFETGKSYRVRCLSGFWEKHIAGPKVLDIGYRGGTPDALPLTDGAIGVELDYPNYDGLNLPFASLSMDTVYSSHVIEHVAPADAYIREWFRVIRLGGTLILAVPHAYLYERRLSVPPSRWSPEHIAAYTPASLLTLIEASLEPNTYRIRFMEDNDAGYKYSLPLEVHPVGALEMTLVLEKIQPPEWKVEP